MADGAFLYQVTHRESGRSYVGITSGALTRRWRAHVYSAAGKSQTHFHRALRKYGRAAFEWRGLAWVPSFAQAAKLERAVVTAERPAYNMTDGGEGTPGFTLPPESRARVAAAARAAMKGKPKSEAHRVVIAAAAVRRAQTEEGRAHLSRLGAEQAEARAAAGLLAICLIDETRKKMSEKAKARCTAEWRARRAERARAVLSSAEGQAKLQAGRQRKAPR